MSAAHIHPELRKLARVVPKAPIRAATLPLFRAASRLQKKFPARGVTVLTTSAGVEVRLHRPRTVGPPAPAMLWIHGGGYVLGTAAQDDVLCRKFARQLGITVAAPEYGLAPEHPYPHALEECYSALLWLASLPSVDPNRIVIAGGSAGGGLAAQLAFLARDRGEITPVAQHLVYPMLDDRSASGHNPGFRLWDHRSNVFGWDAYLADADPEQVVPARRTDLAGLPPAWIGVGTLDLFHDEDIEYAQRLNDAGVPAELDVVDGAFHGFDQIAEKTLVARDFFDRQCEFLRGRFTEKQPEASS
ncbi:esterase [Mycolicibacterium chitae]|uniref:Alpha/beta hydrolase domain-containing protein n=1 Tax=Mycolicibacterium chitae TaxID=1792 RepID=A0A3S4RVV4_MYCCI|nr:alpha/beta hydrolase [Mycolicibacterium chitae]MCV7104260.1 alpha/beta hydrolase [Mycolicibacterium chitae]BBZ01283.1 esterase [Mycolicibacterium chitae]VEG50122.1 alpha/beta hydrolase domain-containing protein [Mycolicibacterium chitae]